MQEHHHSDADVRSAHEFGNLAEVIVAVRRDDKVARLFRLLACDTRGSDGKEREIRVSI